MAELWKIRIWLCYEKFKEIFNLSWKREVIYLLILPCINCRNNGIVICF